MFTMEAFNVAGMPVPFTNSIDIKELTPDSRYESYRLFKLNYEAYKLALHPAFDTSFSLNLARGIIPFDHQVNSVKKLLSRTGQDHRGVPCYDGTYYTRACQTSPYFSSTVFDRTMERRDIF